MELKQVRPLKITVTFGKFLMKGLLLIYRSAELEPHQQICLAWYKVHNVKAFTPQREEKLNIPLLTWSFGNYYNH